MASVYFYETFKEEDILLKRFAPARLKAGYTAATIQESNDKTPPAEIISIRDQSIMPREWLPRLDGILSRSTGYDHLKKLESETDSALQLGYLPLYCNRSVAEQALLLWMALLRKLPRQREHFRRFDRDGLTGSECQGKTLLVVGVGNIGHEIVKIGRGLGMRVFGMDIVRRHDDVQYTEFAAALPEADIVVSAMNLTPENVNYFNYQSLQSAKRGAVFVNVARGEQSSPSELKRLLDDGILGGVALDVYPFETELGTALRMGLEIKNSELKIVKTLADYPNVIFTPHNAFNTSEAVERKAEQSIRQVLHLLDKGQFLWRVPE